MISSAHLPVRCTPMRPSVRHHHPGHTGAAGTGPRAVQPNVRKATRIPPPSTLWRTFGSSACYVSDSEILRLPQDRRLQQSVEALHAGGVLPAGSILMDAPPATTFKELTALAVDVPGWRQMCAATFPTLGKPRGGGNASGSNPAAPSAALNPDATVYSHLSSQW